MNNKKTKEEKLEALKAFLKENNIPFEKNYYSKSFDITMVIRVVNLRIAEFFSEGLEKGTELIQEE